MFIDVNFPGVYLGRVAVPLETLPRALSRVRAEPALELELADGSTRVSLSQCSLMHRWSRSSAIRMSGSLSSAMAVVQRLPFVAAQRLPIRSCWILGPSRNRL